MDSTGLLPSPSAGLLPLQPQTRLPPFDGTFGSLFIGMNISTVLYGVACAQTFLYATSHRSRKDGWILKGLPLDTVYQFIMFTGMYRFLITDYSNPLRLGDTNTGSGDLVHVLILGSQIGGALGLVIVLSVQLYYAWRLWTFSNNTSNALRFTLVIGTVVFSLLTFVIIVRAFPTILSGPFGLLISNTNAFSKLVWGLQLSTTIACDAVITFGMMLSLRRTRAQFRSTNYGLNFLMVLTFNTGLLTVILCVLCLICFYALQSQHNLAYAALSIIIPKCECCGFLCSVSQRLNSRGYLREQMVMSVPISGAPTSGSRPKILYTTEKLVERDGWVE
ncbi:hypothetical protein BDN72DRAFT_839755 [Pluteus cervinus]|uniref:Uncharacterized protein n=1 Tax=Pluteus cervinus TaxID=181527 RepID=A0ACD3AVW7_9AGAR|nr:hypothetical protein BDN72DRAFT_839755 [Pluteus cervinus]